ncbi:Nuclear pore complex subunit [Ceratocystis lukuohia]|uniref:Nuclear pore complex subunit n=1 Tax=Ceratocystis lukuohia TaxID=2019550 RepID=A0ABR4MFN2_9PEZI
MFSPSAAEQGVQTRSRRRRQRPKSTEESEPLPKAKRQRLPLSEQPAPNSTSTTRTKLDMAPETAEVKPSKIAMLNMSPSPASEKLGMSLETPRRELSMRSKKPKTGERVSKGDGSVILVTNNAFTVSKLPGLPDRMRAEAFDAQCGGIFSSTGYGLSLTHTHALVWPYTSAAASPETFTFTLPQTPRNPSDPLPLGSLVAPSASTPEPGLVVIMPTTGRITFWESISSAATMDLMRQQRHGVEHTISGLSSGENAIQLTSADPSGFVVAFSSGRLGYMSVRDAHGRPAIAFQFLNSNLAPASHGIFGSIRNALGQYTSRGDIAAVHSERTSRVGERNITAATSKGKFLAWRFHRGGQNEVLNEVDLCDSLLRAVRTAMPQTKDFPDESFALLDFTYVPKGLDAKHMDMSRLSDALGSDGSSEQHLLLLVSLTKRYTTRYCLVELIMTPASCNIGMLRPLSSYMTPVASHSDNRPSRPRLYLPRPALVAFVAFDHSVVVASIANPPESPESQLQEEVTHALPDMFEDTIDLRDESSQEIIGSGFEEISSTQNLAYEDGWVHRNSKPKNPATVILVRGVGLLRIATNDIDKFASERAPEVTAKSKLEQTVFFGCKAGTPLVFDGRRETHFTNEELSSAAVNLSSEILKSTNAHMGTLPLGMAENLTSRREALDRLIKHLTATNVNLSRSARWELLWDAEKMLVASLLWARHEEYMAANPSTNKEETFIRRLIFFVHEKQKKDLNKAIGELDAVRHWFIHDVWRMDLFMAWICESVKVVSKHKMADEVQVTENINDAIDLYVMSLSAAYKFRQENLAKYGLEDEKLDHGVLSSYEELPEPWTGQRLVSTQLKKLLEMCYRWIRSYSDVFSKQMDSTKNSHPSAEAIAQIISGLPGLTDCYLLSTLEQARYCLESSVARDSAYGQQCKKQYNADKFDKVVPLSQLELWDEAEALAHKHQSWDAIAEILVTRADALSEKLRLDKRLSPSEAERIKLAIKEQETRLEKYFNELGKPFAYAAYDVLLKHHGVSGVLDFGGDHKSYKTSYLRGRGELARISWINDIQLEKDLSHAANTLLNLGSSREQQVWNKKIELSLGKLALMASECNIKSVAQPKLGFPDFENSDEKRMADVDRQLSTIKIQDALYHVVYSNVREALDETAELELSMESFAVKIPSMHKVSRQVFESGMQRLLQHEALDTLTLVDLLTMGRYELPDFYPFFLALQVAESGLSGEHLKKTVRLIWRRCLIADDWTVVNATQGRDDSEVMQILVQTQFFSTARQCLLQYEDANAVFRPLKPSDVLGVFTDEPDRRFADMEQTYQDKLMAAAAWEDSVLKGYMDKHRLEHWALTISKDRQAMLSSDVAAAAAGQLPLPFTTPAVQLSPAVGTVAGTGVARRLFMFSKDGSAAEESAGDKEQQKHAREHKEQPARATRSSRRLNGGNAKLNSLS